MRILTYLPSGVSPYPGSSFLFSAEYCQPLPGGPAFSQLYFLRNCLAVINKAVISIHTKALYNGQKYELFYIYGLAKWRRERVIAARPDHMSSMPGTRRKEGKT